MSKFQDYIFEQYIKFRKEVSVDQCEKQSIPLEISEKGKP